MWRAVVRKRRGCERASPNLTTLSLAGALYPPHFPCVCEKCRENFTLVSCCFFFVVRTNIKTKSKREGVRERERERTYFYVRLVGGKTKMAATETFGNLAKWKTCFFLGVREQRFLIFQLFCIQEPFVYYFDFTQALSFYSSPQLVKSLCNAHSHTHAGKTHFPTATLDLICMESEPVSVYVCEN